MPGRDHGDAWREANTAWDVIGLLLSGILVCGGLGWLLDRVFGFTENHLFLPVGMVAGVGISIWLVYRKYGRDDPTT